MITIDILSHANVSIARERERLCVCKFDIDKYILDFTMHISARQNRTNLANIRADCHNTLSKSVYRWG